MTKYIIILSGITGLTALIMSSLSAHNIKPMLIENETLDSFKIAQSLLIIQSIMAIIATLTAHYFGVQTFNWSAWSFLLGGMLFASPIFIKAFNITDSLSALTPIGGLILIIGWLLIIVGATRIS